MRTVRVLPKSRPAVFAGREHEVVHAGRRLGDAEPGRLDLADVVGAGGEVAEGVAAGGVGERGALAGVEDAVVVGVEEDLDAALRRLARLPDAVAVDVVVHRARDRAHLRRGHDRLGRDQLHRAGAEADGDIRAEVERGAAADVELHRVGLGEVEQAGVGRLDQVVPEVEVDALAVGAAGGELGPDGRVADAVGAEVRVDRGCRRS